MDERRVARRATRCATTMSEQHIIYLAEFKAIVCRQCQYGISKDGLRKHFFREHEQLRLNVRKELEKYVETLDLLEPPKVQVPMREIKPIEELKIQEGFICTVGQCTYLAGTPRSIEEHYYRASGRTEKLSEISLQLEQTNDKAYRQERK